MLNRIHEYALLARDLLGCAVDADAVKRVGPDVAQILGAKGGGRPGLYQGKALLNAAGIEAVKQRLDKEV